ncbi:MAG: class I SAM-dependent methyltransferase [Lactovum sp.]
MATAGHTFLAKLGKKRLRPGGIEATTWLLDKGEFNKDKKVLEVACNMGTTLIEVASKYHCSMTGVDLDKEALSKAEKNVKEAGLSDTITLVFANAMKLPFEDNSFDIIINEAMLTMFDNRAKSKALAEYYRVLKPGGKLLTLDIALKKDNSKEQEDGLHNAIKIKANPLTVVDWKKLYNEAGFKKLEAKIGDMSLMTPRGMIRDEGLKGTFNIIRNGLKSENKEQFIGMFKYFKQEKKNMNYIAHCAEK